jgi:hypothetical protein
VALVRPGRARGECAMKERVKVFTFISGHGETLVDPPHEDHINQWLASAAGQIQEITQSESGRSGAGHHVTVCVWYIPDEKNPRQTKH